MYLSYLPRIKKFGLPPSVSFLVDRNVHDEESLPLVSVSKGCTFFFKVWIDVYNNIIPKEEFLS